MSGSSSSSTRGDVRLLRDRLDAVFSKAIDSAMGSISPDDIDVGDLKGRNKLATLLVNKLDKIDKDFKAQFSSMCAASNVDNIMLDFQKLRQDDPLDRTVATLQAAEETKLLEAIAQLQNEIISLDSEISRSCAVINANMSELSRECNTLSDAISFLNESSSTM